MLMELRGWRTFKIQHQMFRIQLSYTATGGTITTCGDFKIHTFTADGCFAVTAGGSKLSADYLVIAVVVAGGA